MVVMGRNISPRPTPRRMRGQKKSLSPAVGTILSDIQKVKKKKMVKPTGIMYFCGTPACRALPMMGIMKPATSAPGSSKYPVWAAVKPRIRCVKIGNTKMDANSPKPSTNDKNAPTARLRLLASTRKSTMGCRAVSSRQMKPTTPTADSRVKTTMLPSSNQSLLSPCSSTYCNEPTPSISSPMPAQSISRSGRGTAFLMRSGSRM